MKIACAVICAEHGSQSEPARHECASSAANSSSGRREEAPRLRPFVTLAEKLGSFATETGIKKVRLSHGGDVARMNTVALTSAAIAGLLRPILQNINVVSAPGVAKERGIAVQETGKASATMKASSP